MTLPEFKNSVEEIARYLGSTPYPSAEVIAAWFERVEYIPAKAVPYIVRRITDDAERMPKNLPKQFRALYCEWQAEHATPTAPIQQTGCGECVEGILWLEKPGTGETAVIYCTCYRGNPGAIGRTSLWAMERQGWQKIDMTYKYPPDITDKWARKISAKLQQARMDYCHPDYRRIDSYEDQPFF